MALKSALQALSRFFYAEFTVKIHLLATDTHGLTQTIYPLVSPPADKVFCPCLSVPVEKAQRTGG